MERITLPQLGHYADIALLLDYVARLNDAMIPDSNLPLPDPPEAFEEGFRDRALSFLEIYEPIRKGVGSPARREFYAQRREELSEQLLADANEMISALVAAGAGKRLHSITSGDLVPTKMFPQSATVVHNAVLRKLLPAIREAIEQVNRDLDKRSKTVSSGSAPEKRKLLRGGLSICEALGLPKSSWRGLKRMNEMNRGPITCPGRGKPPMVYQHELLAWMDTMKNKSAESAEGSIPDKGVLPGGHAWGKKGHDYYPDVKMHEQRRRKDLGKKKKND